MSIVTVIPVTASTISSSGSDSVVFVGIGTLNIAGTAQNPITVTLSQVAGAGLLDTINLSYADVTLGGVVGVSALVNYNIGTGSTLRLQSTVGIALGSTINFTALNSHLVVNSGVNLNQLGNIGIAGFGPGSNIDLAATGATGYSYADGSGVGTGGTLTLLGSGGTTIGSVVLTTGEFTTASFNVHPDGSGGTLVDFATYVSGILATPATADLTVGGNVVLMLATTAPVTIAGGPPTLTLNDGGTATYDAAHSTATNLQFNYTVQAGQNTSDLAITAVNLNGTLATDELGKPVSLAGAIGNPAGTLQIDTTPPTITNISTTPGSGSLSAGQVVAINLTTSEAVTVVGMPTLTLNDGGTASYDALHSTATNLVFTYTVQPGQNVADLAIIGTNLNGAAITDAAGNVANLAGAVGNPAGILQIDTTSPTITGISTTPGSGSLGAGQVVAINLAPSEAVTVSGGTPTLTLNDGRTAAYDSVNSTATNLVFKYTVQPGDNTTDLTITGYSLNGATISDAAGNNASLAGAVGNPSGILQIDTTPPTITGISTTPSSGTLTAGQVVAISLTPSEAVTVAGGTPTLTLDDGRTATYDPNSSTATNLVFKYVVQPGDHSSDLTVTGYNSNGASITDTAGNPANLAGAVGNPPGILQINTTQPAVTSVYGVTTTPGSGDLGANSTVALRVALTGNATVSTAGGSPTLTLSDGGTATYDAVDSTPTMLVFQYTVQPGQNTADLTVTATALNGAVILGGSGTPVDLSGAVTNPGGILQIDTTAPTINSVTTTPGSGSLGAGQTVEFNIATSEAVTVSGTPTLTLDDGGIATYSAASSTATNLVFNYTVQPGQNSADLIVTAYNSNGSTIADGAGNALNLAGILGNPPGTLKIDTTPPTVIAVAILPANGTVTLGQVVAINVTPSEAVLVSGATPTLTLDDGGTAVYDAASSTPTNLVFKYTVQPGQNTADLTITGSSLNGAAITDLAGNALNLSGVVGNPSGTLQVNTVPVVTSVVATPVNADLTIGATITLQVNISGPAIITGGAPTLSLNDGGTATYDASSSTPTNLVFRNTVQAGQNTPDLGVAAVFLNGASIMDGTGQTVSLAGAIGNPAGILQIDTIAPTVTSVVLGGSLEAGSVFTLTAYISEPVTMAPGASFSVLLANGGVSTYDPTLSTPTSLVSTYTTPAGSHLTAADVAIVGFNNVGPLATDGAGNPLSGPSFQAAIQAAQGNFADVLEGGSPTTIDVYRFFDKNTGTHFYTSDQTERQTILATRPDLVPEGPNGVGLTAVDPASNDPNAAPVYRFFDTKQGTQFLTASSSERDTVIATRPDLMYEPSSTFYEHTTQQAGDTAVYRFFDTKFGTHFYTDDPVERGVILQTRPDLVQEGVGFYELARNPAT